MGKIEEGQCLKERPKLQYGHQVLAFQGGVRTEGVQEYPLKVQEYRKSFVPQQKKKGKN